MMSYVDLVKSEGCQTDVQVESGSEVAFQTEQRLQKILGMLFDGILILKNGVIVETNKGLLSMTGYDASELFGHGLEELDGWQDLAKTLSGATEEEVSFEALLPRKNLRPLFATVRAACMSWYGTKFVVAVVAGMTEDQPASASLLRSAERYRSLFESVPDIIFTKDSDLRFSEVNPAMEKTFGLTGSQIVGQTAEQIYGKAAGERIRAWDLRVLSGETIEEEHAVLVKGEPLTFHDVRVPIKNREGEIVGVCGICRNITERKKIPQSFQDNLSAYSSTAMGVTMKLASQASATDCIVLLQGESGTGKDYLARWIHDHSLRSNSPFLSINCAALPHEIAESELFGHEAGAFTGAKNRKRGLLELAEGGTLLLNEIGELPIALQSKLLAFLDTRSFHRLGGEKVVRVDARIMAASHRNLEGEVIAGRFLEPLFYRLNVFSIRLPNLCERTEDIPLLATEIISTIVREMNIKSIPELDPSALKVLTSYGWPGNIRELRNLLERAIILQNTGRLKIDLPSIDANHHQLSLNLSLANGRTLRELSREVTKSICLETIRRCRGNKKAAAKALGVSRDSLYRHIMGPSKSVNGVDTLNS